MVRFVHQAKGTLIALVLLATVSALAGLVWLNQNGFKGEWSERIADELSSRGIHAEFSWVRFSPTRGILARDVVLYRDKTSQEVLARIPRLRFDVDRSKALRGELKIRRVHLHDAELNLPLLPDGGELTITDLFGKAHLDRHDRFVLSGARGSLAGMTFRLDVALDGVELDRWQRRSPPPDHSVEGEGQSFTHSLLRELAHWSFPDDSPPELALRVTGDVSQPSTLRSQLTLQASELRRAEQSFQKVELHTDFRQNTVTIETLSFADRVGEFQLEGFYDLTSKEGLYSTSSSIDLKPLLDSTGNDLLKDLTSSSAPQVEARGSVQMEEEGLQISARGSLQWKKLNYRDLVLEDLSTEFSWKEGNLYLRGLEVNHGGGRLTGQLLQHDEFIRYRAKSTLPLSAYQKFISPRSTLGRTLARYEPDPANPIVLTGGGAMRRDDLGEWTAVGHLHLPGGSYRGIPLTNTHADFNLSPHRLRFTNVRTTFDYRNYYLHRRYGGPSTANARVAAIEWSNETGLTRLTNLRGTIWPGPFLSLFAPEAAQHVEQDYRFHQPPTLVANGVIDNRHGKRLDITTKVLAPGTTNYTFLGESLPVTRLSATVRTRHRQHNIDNLSFHALGGSAGGKLSVRHPERGSSQLKGELRWDNLSLAKIGRSYQFEKAAHGHITGQIDFSGAVGDPSSLKGSGVIGLRNGQLFHVPVFGPLSLPIGGILGKTFSHEQARDASATFVIQRGTVLTNDFLTSTPSTVFTGEGRLDLAKEDMDMTVRMNARGLLGLVTLPLRPFNGLFQFRGSGPLKKPVWRSAPFTQPAAGRSDPIFRPPARARIVKE